MSGMSGIVTLRPGAMRVKVDRRGMDGPTAVLAPFSASPKLSWREKPSLAGDRGGESGGDPDRFVGDGGGAA